MKLLFTMATKSANLYARIEPDVKEQAEGILAALGIPASNAINMFYKQIILQRGLPFEVKMPSARPVDVSALSEAQMNAELEKGYAALQKLAQKAKEHQCYLSPNIYLQSAGGRYDASLWITPDGVVQDVAKMEHIAQNKNFYEQDYYTPAKDGFKVFSTPFGKTGIVICFDRHLPENIRTCALKGADLVIVPTANTKAEPMELFEWEIRVQAMQNQVFIAMCNRVGMEDLSAAYRCTTDPRRLRMPGPMIIAMTILIRSAGINGITQTARAADTV